MSIECTVKRKKYVIKQKVFSRRCISTRWWQDRSVTTVPVPACVELSILAFSTSGKLLIIMKILEMQGPLSRHTVTLAVFPPTMQSTRYQKPLCYNKGVTSYVQCLPFTL